ncbi:20289_t:CDS:1 [Funneliformis geosporum]|nr:20289_t:CDS:1 [Funneliformis geosporum]
MYKSNILSCVGAEFFKKEREVNAGCSTGKSSGSAVVLAMLSAYHQKPISRSVATTGSIAGRAKTQKAKTTEGKEMDLPAGTNLPITGLKLKIEGAIEKGIDRFVFSKYQTSPHLLSLKYTESSYAGNEIRTEEK